MKEALEQVVDLFRAPARKPNKYKDFQRKHHFKKRLAVLAQYKFACKQRAGLEASAACPRRWRSSRWWQNG
jgi:hypothetical protein